MGIQAQIPTALCAVHNFICEYDPAESPTNDNNDDDNDDEDWRGGYFDRNVEEDDIATVEEDDELKFHQGSAMRDHIASAIWADYQHILLEHDFDGVDLDEEDMDEDGEDEGMQMRTLLMKMLLMRTLLMTLQVKMLLLSNNSVLVLHVASKFILL